MVRAYALAHGRASRMLREEDHPPQTVLVNEAHEPFPIGVEVRTSGDLLHPGTLALRDHARDLHPTCGRFHAVLFSLRALAEHPIIYPGVKAPLPVREVLFGMPLPLVPRLRQDHLLRHGRQR
jgi:hypothetical protein